MQITILAVLTILSYFLLDYLIKDHNKSLYKDLWYVEIIGIISSVLLTLLFLSLLIIKLFEYGKS